MPNFYKIQYQDPEGNVIKCNIQQSGTLERSSTVIEVGGTVDIAFDEIDDPLQVIRTSSATISLEADTTQTFDDLYTEIERVWIALVYRNDVLVFRGWLSPDGIFEDYVNDSWVIQLEARDGISDLQNKAYVDADGNLYEGQATLRTILLNCLSRTGFSQYTRFQHRSASVTNFPFEMVTTWPSVADYFDQKVDQRAFLSTDGKTAKSCQEVIEAILTPCNGHLYSWAGEWYINWSLQHANPNLDGAFTYTKYEIDGTQDVDVDEDVNTTIGSHIKGFSPHWAGGNQRIERRPSVGAARISYQFLDKGAIITNPELDNNGSTITGWTLSGDATLDASGIVTIDAGSQSTPALVSDTSANQIDEGTIVTVDVNLSISQDRPACVFKIRVVLDDGVTPYYLNQDLEWQTGATEYIVGLLYAPGEYNVNLTSDVVPVSGDLTISIYPLDDKGGNPLFVSEADFNYVGLGNDAGNPAEGIEYSAERTANPSSYIQPTVELNVGDWTGIKFLGTFYRNDGTTETDAGYVRPTSAFAFPLYQCNVIDRLFIRSKPSRIFEGGVYGWVPYNSRVTVDGFSEVVWIVSGWNWNTKENLIEIRLFEIHWDTDMLDDTTYEKIINYGEAIEPKIKG